MRLNRLEKHIASAAVAAGFASAASAAIITWNINAAIPATLDGMYIRIDNQTSTTGAGSGLAGWDINPYGSTTLNFYASATAPNPATTYVRTQASGGPSSLALGTVIGGSSPFANSTTAVVSATGVGSNGWVANSVNYFGFRFHNNTTGANNYGFGAMQVGASATSRTLLFLQYGDAGESVTVGAIPAPGALALLGVAGLAGRRRRA
jgi:MYXO-CTERM domain-containing protein